MSSGSYDPKTVEKDIYAFWEQGGHFRAVPNPDRPSYVIDIPLPNITGALHMGHALNNTVQDMLIRYHRMRGYEALWMPGTDHAGIATQAVVERKLKEEQGLTRHELGRDGLVKKIWEWRDEYGGRILQQLRALGASCDWDRTRFTLDEVCAKAVYEVFFQWFKEGLIYRGLRLVNWDAFLQTAVADDEIVHETVKGSLWHYRYPILPLSEPRAQARGDAATARDQGIEGSRDQGGGIEGIRDSGSKDAPPALSEDDIAAALARATAPDAQLGVDYLVIATTRPETMLGDTAIAVHPSDPRWQHLIGRYALLPLMNRPIPIIADALLVSMEFGTGCVKVTPAHDPNDYAFSQRHPEAQAINILTKDGKINEQGRTQARGGMAASSHAAQLSKLAQPDDSAQRSKAEGGHATLRYDYSGLDRYVARKKVVEDLEALGLMEKIEPYETEIGHSDRSKTPIEPMLSEQWFVKMGGGTGADGRPLPDLAGNAMEAVRDGRVRFFPERYAKTYLDWLGEKRDWCISRQLWWGHRIPVWRSALGTKREHISLEYADLLKGWERANRVAFSPFDLETLRLGGAHLPWNVCVHNPRDREVIDSLEAAGYGQDPDVLDTWFSSALWPFSTLGWPDDYGTGSREQGIKGSRSESGAPTLTPRSLDPLIPTSATGGRRYDGDDLDYFYPTTVLVTAREIITLWVARMVMTGLHFQGRVPFSHVHIHPNIQDAQGSRMSKTAGNGVDPLDIIEMFGTDALRFGMIQLDSETQDARMPVMYRCPHCAQSFSQLPEHMRKPAIKCKHCKKEFATQFASAEQIGQLGLGRLFSDRFEMGRNFCNKIWQAATGVVLANLEGDQGIKGSRDQGSGAPLPTSPPSHLPTPAFRALKLPDLEVEDRWILSRLRHTLERIDTRYAHYQLNDVAAALYDFFWGDFCDWYLELVKPRLFGRGAKGPRGQGAEGAKSARAEGAKGSEAGSEPSLATSPLPHVPTSSVGDVVPRDDNSARVARQMLVFVLDHALRMMHPVLPFVSEALWRQLNERAPRRGLFELHDLATAEPALINAAWPAAARLPDDPQVEREIAALQDVIRALRDTLARVNASRSAAKHPAIGKLPAAVIRAEERIVARLQDQQAVLERLGRCERVEVGANIAKPPESATQVLPGVEVYVPLAGLMDLAAERKRLMKERDELRVHIERLAAKLANEGFTAKAPAAVVQQERTRLAEMQDRIATLERNVAELE